MIACVLVAGVVWLGPVLVALGMIVDTLSPWILAPADKVGRPPPRPRLVARPA